MNPIAIIGYSGHAYVVCDIFTSMEREVTVYCEKKQKLQNPFRLIYLGDEQDEEVTKQLMEYDVFVSIGSNKIRRSIYHSLRKAFDKSFIKAIHSSAVVGQQVTIGAGTMISANVTINALAQIGQGVICNTACVVEHECVIGDFVHIAPGAVLAGAVEVGTNTFIGANAVIKQGVHIGENVVIGAGSVVLKDIPNGTTFVGNPARKLEYT